MSSIPKVKIEKDREWVITSGHPWVYAEAVTSDLSHFQGDVVEVQDHSGQFLAMAFANGKSAIGLRCLSRNRDVIDDDWVKDRLLASIKRRKLWWNEDNQILRMVSFEGDGLPGLIVDRYGDWWVFQILCAGMEAFRDVILKTLLEQGGRGVIERSDENIRLKEGLELRKELCAGVLPESWLGVEHGIRYHIDLWHGHKTGFYIDQRENRRKLRALGEKGRVLNCFSYTGGFSLSCLKGGAEEVVSVDASLPALEQLEKNYSLNQFDPEAHQQIRGDVFGVLEAMAGQDMFDGVILDPPKFAGKKQNVKNALKAYRELNVMGWKLVKPGGWLATFSCSGRVKREEFERSVTMGLATTESTGVIWDWMHQAPDHSVRLGFGESHYLKGLLIHKV